MKALLGWVSNSLSVHAIHARPYFIPLRQTLTANVCLSMCQLDHVFQNANFGLAVKSGDMAVDKPNFCKTLLNGCHSSQELKNETLDGKRNSQEADNHHIGFD